DVIIVCIRLRFASFDWPIETALGRVVAEQVAEIIGRNDIVDRDHIQLFAEQPLFDQSPEHQPANPPKPVNADLHACHLVSPLPREPGGLRPSGRMCRKRVQGLRYDSQRWIPTPGRSTGESGTGMSQCRTRTTTSFDPACPFGYSMYMGGTDLLFLDRIIQPSDPSFSLQSATAAYDTRHTNLSLHPCLLPRRNGAETLA